MNPEFKMEYAVEFWEPENYCKLCKLAEEYHRRCDEFDSKLVPYEMYRYESYRNVLEVDKELFEKAANLGFSRGQWRDVVLKEARKKRGHL